MEGTRIKKFIIIAEVLSLLLAATTGVIGGIWFCQAADAGYSPALIAELGEASTVLVYSQIGATVRVYVPDANWNPTAELLQADVTAGAWASSFFVNSNGYLATAGHALFCFTHTDFAQDPNTRYLLIARALENNGHAYTEAQQSALFNYIQSHGELVNSIRLVYAVLGEVKATLTDVQAKGWVARVVAVSPYIERDIAVLKVELTNCPVLTVGDSDKVVTGDNIYMFGFPAVVTFHAELGPETLLAPSMTRGIISAKRMTNFQTPCFQTDASITHGNSGGPGLNDNGQVVGVCSRGSISEAGQQVAGFDFLIQSNVLKAFLTESSVSNEKGPADEAFLKGLSYYFGRHFTAAKVQFEIASGLFAYHWRANELISECNAAIARGEDVPIGFGIEAWMILGLIGGVVVIAVLAVVLVQRHKRPPEISD